MLRAWRGPTLLGSSEIQDQSDLCLVGSCYLEVYGVRWHSLRLGQTKGLAAVSANHLVGHFPMGGVFGGGSKT
jgi:hypothetical protein